MVDGIALYFFAVSEDQEYWVGPWRLWERDAAAAHRAADEHGQPTDEHGRLLLYDPQSLFEGTDASWVIVTGPYGQRDAMPPAPRGANLEVSPAGGALEAARVDFARQLWGAFDTDVLIYAGRGPVPRWDGDPESTVQTQRADPGTSAGSPLPRIESIHIRGFRSLRDINATGLSNVVVMIGANGSGKSNFIRFFEMLSWMLRSRRLAEFIEMQGGADDQLYRGNRVTPRLEAEIQLRTARGRNDYQFALSHAAPDRFFFSEERFRFNHDDIDGLADWQSVGSAHGEARIVEAAQSVTPIPGVNSTTAHTIVRLLRGCSAYQFHDTSAGSNIKKTAEVDDNVRLRSDGGNLAAVLYRLEREDVTRFELICRHIGRVLPVFDRFTIEESYGKVLLRWKAKGTDKTFGAHLTSDGSLRFFALVTLLNLPPELLPDVILLDEPELGLHPAAITLIADMIRAVGDQRQVIVATQSPLLVDAFSLDEIVVLELRDGETEFRSLDPEDYREWLGDFTTGELWQKNLLGGRP